MMDIEIAAWTVRSRLGIDPAAIIDALDAPTRRHGIGFDVHHNAHERAGSRDTDQRDSHHNVRETGTGVDIDRSPDAHTVRDADIDVHRDTTGRRAGVIPHLNTDERVTGFDVRRDLGGRGTRAMDVGTGMAVADIGRLLDATDVRRDRTAIVLGTGCGSLATSLSFVRSSLSSERPYFVDPGSFPVSIMNYAAGQCAIRHGITGPNTTIASGRSAVAHVLTYAARLLAARRADDVLCGATEEYTLDRAGIDGRARPDRRVPITEGCTIFHMRRSAGPNQSVRLLGVGTALAAPQTAASTLRACIERTLQQAGVASSEIWAVAVSGALDGAAAAEARALNAALGLPGPRRIPVHHAVGDTSAVTGGFAVAGLLALAARDDAPPGAALLATGIDGHGLVTCILLRGPR